MGKKNTDKEIRLLDAIIDAIKEYRDTDWSKVKNIPKAFKSYSNRTNKAFNDWIKYTDGK